MSTGGFQSHPAHSSKSILDASKRSVKDNDSGISSARASFANMTLSTSATDSSEIKVRQFLIGDLYVEAVRRSTMLFYTIRTKERRTELLKDLGTIYLYHDQRRHSDAVADALRDRDWREVDAKVNAMFASVGDRVSGAVS
ncbi:hypothetical protein AYO22_08108 [Fonsecaea multimorphosa]|nr:hypothetical protein AYO22_08108 [Fonsecaea multimorphosa]